GKGNELYAKPLKKAKFLHGSSFGDAWRHFPRATPLGVLLHESGKEPELHLSPDDSFKLTADSSLVVLAGKDKDAEPERYYML
ncbi:MAG: hypothetical protein SGPRY_014868, partial [Prymnesium sp.]